MRKPLIGLLVVVVLASMAPAAHAAFPGANGKIAFYNGQGTSDNIYVMQPDGSGLTAITTGPARRMGSRLVSRRHQDRARRASRTSGR